MTALYTTGLIAALASNNCVLEVGDHLPTSHLLVVLGGFAVVA